MLHFGIHTGLYFHYVDGNPFSVETCHDWPQFIIRDPVPSSKAQRSFLASCPTSPEVSSCLFKLLLPKIIQEAFKKKKNQIWNYCLYIARLLVVHNVCHVTKLQLSWKMVTVKWLEKTESKSGNVAEVH